jgi:hypothetical protein
VADPVDIAVAVASLLLAAALVYVTYALAKHTKALARATEALQAIEARRERGEARRKRSAGLKRKIQLVEVMLGWSFDSWKHDYLARGAYPGPEGDQLRELALLLEFGRDHANRELVEGLVAILERLRLGEAIVGPEADKFVEEAGHLHKLRPDILRWRQELMLLSAEEGSATPES